MTNKARDLEMESLRRQVDELTRELRAVKEEVRTSLNHRAQEQSRREDNTCGSYSRRYGHSGGSCGRISGGSCGRSAGVCG